MCAKVFAFKQPLYKWNLVMEYEMIPYVLVFYVCDECMPILNLDRIKTFKL